MNESMKAYNLFDTILSPILTNIIQIDCKMIPSYHDNSVDKL